MWNIFVLSAELVIFTLLLGFYFIFMPNYFDRNYISLILVIIFISTFIFWFRKRSTVLRGNYFTITFIFILSFLIVHFQFYIDYASSLRTDLEVGYYLDYSIVPKAITLSALSLISFFIGNILFSIKTRNVDNMKVFKKSSFSLMFLMFLILAFFLLFIYATPLEYFKGGYGELSNNEGISYLQYKSNHLLQISLWAYIICNTIIISEIGSKLNFIAYLKTLSFPILLITGIYCSLNIFAGDRGPVISIFILLFAGYLVSQRKVLNLKKMIVVILIGGSFLQFISYFRETGGSGGISERIESAIIIKNDVTVRSESSIFPPTVELAKSVRAYHAVVMDQEYNNILYGLGNLGYLVALIPGLGVLIQSATSVNFSGSATYITNILGADHGLGTTALADIYLNYGFLGVLFIFLFFGYFFAKLDTRGYGSFVSNNLFMQVLFLLFLSSALFLGRSAFAVVFSNVVLVYILIRLSSILKAVNK